MTTIVDSVEAVQDATREAVRLLPIAGGTKPALSTPPEEVTLIDVSGLSGITAYDPAELTFSARAGTPLKEIQALLAEHGQHLPFDPPFCASGATLGGAVAAGVSGPGAFGPGGIRDFVIGARIVDGTGRLIAAGGRVVKNAAGFDLPKLMVGSLGRLGVIVEVSCKVFPMPEASKTLAFDMPSLGSAVEAVAKLGRGSVGIDALDLSPPGRVILRISGAPQLLASRAARVAATLDRDYEALADEDADAHWAQASAFGWVPSTHRVVVVPVPPSLVGTLEQELSDVDGPRRYGIGGNVAWIAWPRVSGLHRLDARLRALRLTGVTLTGEPEASPLLGAPIRNAFSERVRASIDPNGRFMELWP